VAPSADCLQALHRLLFPIDYEDTFYSSALNEENG